MFLYISGVLEHISLISNAFITIFWFIKMVSPVRRYSDS